MTEKKTVRATDLNLFALAGWFAPGVVEIANGRFAPGDVYHLRRCLRAGLVEATRSAVRLTEEGVAAVAKWREENPTLADYENPEAKNAAPKAEPAPAPAEPNAEISIDYRAREAGFSAADIDVGTPATVSLGSDARAATVVEVVRRADGEIRRVVVREDARVRSVYLPACGNPIVFTRRADGRLREKGSRKGSSRLVAFGYRETDLDRSF